MKIKDTSRRLAHSHRKKRFTLFVAINVLAIILTACGGGGGGGPRTTSTGGITGTGFVGKTAIGAAIANADIRIKSASGVAITTRSDNEGSFSSDELLEANANVPRDAYLLRVDQGNGDFLYSIAHSDNAASIDDDSVSIEINIHPYTDLIIRNWFAQQALDIDNAFAGNTPIANLPSADDIERINNELLSIFEEAFSVNNVAIDTNLLSTPFNADGTGFDSFLDNSTVNINNNIVNVIINQPQVANPVQNTIITDVNLTIDFTSNADLPPSLPGNLRVLATDVATEALLVWEPSSDDKGVARYEIFREGVLIDSTPFPVFIDTGLSSNVNYQYTIEAVDGRGQRSGITTAVTITLDAPDVTPPPTATNLQGSEANGVVELSWDQGMIDDVAGFRILRGPSGNANTEIANITSTTFTDFNVLAGTTYCYRVVSYDAAGNESAATAESCVNVGGATPAASMVTFSSPTYSVEESSPSIVITVNRTGDVSQAISVDYSATANTATAGTDVVETNGTLTWGATDASVRTFSIQINETPEVESDETVDLTLTNPSNTTLGTNASAVLTITDAPQVACVVLSPTTITTNTTLSEPCYSVNADVAIRNNATLTIEPGVRLEFDQGMRFEVESDGVLSAIGTSQNPITFTGALASNGFWDGIEIRSVVTSQIDNAVVEYGGNTSSFNPANIGISFEGRLNLANSTIRHSGSYGIAHSGSAVLVGFTANTITLNEDAPITVPANQVGAIAADNLLAGNNTIVGGDRDYIEVQNASGSSGITTNQTWNLLDVDYRMFPGLSTNVDAELTIAPGVTLIFGANAYLNIRTNGTLNAVGTPAQPITFTALQPTPGFWAGIQFTFNSTDNILDNTIVEYAGGTGSNITANVGVFSTSGRLTLRNSLLRESAGYGFSFANNINLTMENVTSTANNQPGEIAFNDVGLLDSGSDYSGNTDDRVVLAAGGTVGDFIDQTMKNISIPYFVSSNNTTSINAQLTIEPGTEIQFNSSGGLNIQTDGVLIAQGTPAQPIIFTGALQFPGYWNGIQHTFSNSPSNIIDNAVIEYAGAPSGNTQALVGYFGTNTSGNVTNTVLRGSQTNGIWIDANTAGDFTTGNSFEDIADDNIFTSP